MTNFLYSESEFESDSESDFDPNCENPKMFMTGLRTKSMDATIFLELLMKIKIVNYKYDININGLIYKYANEESTIDNLSVLDIKPFSKYDYCLEDKHKNISISPLFFRYYMDDIMNEMYLHSFISNIKIDMCFLNDNNNHIDLFPCFLLELINNCNMKEEELLYMVRYIYKVYNPNCYMPSSAKNRIETLINNNFKNVSKTWLIKNNLYKYIYSRNRKYIKN